MSAEEQKKDGNDEARVPMSDELTAPTFVQQVLVGKRKGFIPSVINGCVFALALGVLLLFALLPRERDEYS